MKKYIKKIPAIKSLLKNLDNQNERDEFIKARLNELAKKSLLLDAGCGSQRYRDSCSHLIYKAQDFGEYTIDQKKMIGTEGVGGKDGYEYGKLDYVGNIWDINENDDTFDAILCTEVFEHIPHPIEAIKEFKRLLKVDGKLILTAPSNCLRHMDPYFFYTGFSDRWYENILSENKFQIEIIKPLGDYYSWMAVEIFRTALTGSIFTKLIMLPAFIYYYNKKKTEVSIDTMCMGYMIVAKKLSN